MISRRSQRAEKEIQYWVSRYFLAGLKGQITSLVSVTRVVVSGDLRSAKIFIHGFDQAGVEFSEFAREKFDRQTCERLEERHGEIQRYLSSNMPMRYTPRLHFIADRSFDKVLKIESILHEIRGRPGQNP